MELKTSHSKLIKASKYPANKDFRFIIYYKNTSNGNPSKKKGIFATMSGPYLIPPLIKRKKSFEIIKVALQFLVPTCSSVIT